MQPKLRNARATGFTLVELLVVIAIIAILAGMLLPALSKAKSRTQGIQCMNNTHQMVYAWKMYASDNQEKVPAAGPGGNKRTPSWVTNNWETLGSPRDPNNWDANTYIKSSCLWPYCGKSLSIWHCPADSSTAINNQGQVVPRIRSISMLCWVGGPKWTADVENWKVYGRTTDMLDPGPSTTFVFLDERQDSINDGYFVVDMGGFPGTPTTLGDYPASYHLNAGGLAFADGHSEIHGWKDTRTMPPLSTTDLTPNVSSPGNLDVAWLQVHATRD